LEGEGKSLDAGGMVDYYADLVKRYPIVSIEDGMPRTIWPAGKKQTDKLGKKIQLVGDGPVRHQPQSAWPTHQGRHCQRHPGEGEPNRHAD